MVKVESGKFLVIIFAFATAFSAIHIKIKEVLQHLIEADKNAYRIFHCHFPTTDENCGLKQRVHEYWDFKLKMCLGYIFDTTTSGNCTLDEKIMHLTYSSLRSDEFFYVLSSL